MEELLSPIAAFLHSVLPGWMTLPHLTFVLPHTVYWLGLLLFPPIAIFLCKRAKATKKKQVSLGIAYLLWLWGGFVGLHRFYLKSWILGVVYTVLF